MRKQLCIICKKLLTPVNVEDPSVCSGCMRCLTPECKSLVVEPDYAEDGSAMVTCPVCKKSWPVAEYEEQLAMQHGLVFCKHCEGLGYLAKRGRQRKPVPLPAPTYHEPAIVEEEETPEDADPEDEGTPEELERRIADHAG